MATFVANCVVIDDMEDYWFVGFADSELNTEHYLMLERAYEDDEQDIANGMNTYHVELDDQGFSCYGGIERFALSKHKVVIQFNQSGTQSLGVNKLEIQFTSDNDLFDKLKNRLEHVFADTNCLVYENS